MSDWKESRIIVGQEDGAKRQVKAYVGKDGEVGMHVHDLGDREYEYYLWVKVQKRDKLVIALMEDLYGDRQSCASGFEELMKENGISCERHGEWKESKTIVGGEGSPMRQVVAFVDKEGGVGLQVHDLGGPRGREDYEFYVEVPASEKERLILALLGEIYAGQDSCPNEFESLMEKNGIPSERYVI
ncbi:MAG: hypothetical protein HN531_14485 [Opitutae bacterium]|nr:hypothetical protein [Opitutae bacterium]